MGPAKLNIWIRNEDCSLRNAWRADLEVKTCLGENLIDILPPPDLEKIISHLKEMFPEFDISYGPNYGTKTIRVQGKRVVNHLQVEVPPGCYVVRVHVCGGGNEWSDRTMVVVGCGDESCVNLIIKEAETCGGEFMIPFLRLAEEVRIPREQLQVAANVLAKAARIPINEVAEDLQERVKQLRDVKEAIKVVSEAESGLRIIKRLRLRKKK